MFIEGTCKLSNVNKAWTVYMTERNDLNPAAQMASWFAGEEACALSRGQRIWMREIGLRNGICLVQRAFFPVTFQDY